jgi:hypothetical protein
MQEDCRRIAFGSALLVIGALLMAALITDLAVGTAARPTVTTTHAGPAARVSEGGSKR